MTIALFIPNILLLYSNIKNIFMNYNSIIRNIFSNYWNILLVYIKSSSNAFDSIIVVINV